jgi:prolipoprotein diacylglyceryl transferase
MTSLLVLLIPTLFVDWSVDPVFVQFGPFTIRYYGLLFLAALMLDVYIFRKFFKWEKVPLPLLDALTWWTVVALFVGLRLGHCFFYAPVYYITHPVDILKVWEGGLASHGGAIGLLVGLWFFCRKYKMRYLWLFDRLVIVVPLTGVFVRTGNLINSEVYGMATNLPWGFIFRRYGESVPKHPTQIYEALAYLVIFIVLFLVYKKRPALRNRSGFLFGLACVLIFAFRFCIEFIKETQDGDTDAILRAAVGIDMGQLLSIPLVLAGIVLLWNSLRRPPCSQPFVVKRNSKH